MQTIFDTCTPRPEVRHGALSEDMFAARLRDVMDDKADEVYQDPDRFFANTYPTDGLRTLLNEVLGRITGQAPTSSPILRLETSFGGGKTHNLIALYHATKGYVPPAVHKRFGLGSLRLPDPGEVAVAGVVGSDLDPSNGMTHQETGITTYTLWGELAYQLGGAAGYALAANSDRDRTAPGTALFEALVADRPTLIMIDEIARHLRSASGVPTSTGEGTLADQTVAFLMTLMEFVASKQRVVLVLTMASDRDAFGKETAALQESLAEALKVSARQERVLTPTGENEIAAIVVHRLFETVDRSAVLAVMQRYGGYYRRLSEQGASLHDRALRGDYLQEFEASYPFHPELIRVLNLKVATIPNFQRTRGALRLLANVVRALWDERPKNAWLIHPYHVDLSKQPIVEDLTSRLDRPKFKQVCEADIVSPVLGIPAHASEVDKPLLASGKPAYARRLATTIFLHSLTQGIATGVEAPELLLATLTPGEKDGDDPAVAGRALERLYQTAWFLEYDGFRYRFKTEPSLNKIVEDETPLVGLTRAKQEVEERVRKIWRAGYMKPIYFPSTPVEVDDDAGKPKLVIMHFDAVKARVEPEEPPDLVRHLYEHAGALESFRVYPNNLVFLVADEDQAENMVAVARRYLAIGRITGNAQRMQEFHKEHQKELRKMGEAAELQVRLAITKAYRYLFYPTGDAPKSQSYLRRETMPPQDQGDTDQDQTNVAVRVLRTLQKALAADDPPRSGPYVKAKAWDKNQVEMSSEDLRRAFARKIGLPMLLDVNQLKRSIENGVKTRSWLYYVAAEDFAYDHESPAAVWQISDDVHLYTPEEAQRLGLRIKGKWRPSPEYPPDEPEDEGPSDDELDALLGGGPPAQLRGHGVPAQAFQQILDQAQEHEAVALRRLELAFRGIEAGRANDLVAMGLAIPQMGKAAFGIKLTLIVQFDDTTGEYARIEFQGGWERYQRIKQVSDALVKDKKLRSLNVDFRLVVEFDGDLALSDRQFGDMRDALTNMGVSTLDVSATPMYGEAT
jgi:hypothetical protein